MRFLPIHSGHQIRWTYQPGSHRRKNTQDFSSTFFCGACLNFSREKDSAIPFPRRLWSRILCTNDLIVLHSLGSFILFFSFLVRKIPFAGIELTSQRVRGRYCTLTLIAIQGHQKNSEDKKYIIKHGSNNLLLHKLWRRSHYIETRTERAMM